VDENLEIAHKRDACRQEKFYMRKHIDDSTSESGTMSAQQRSHIHTHILCANSASNR
jgi:hypothetical protein